MAQTSQSIAEQKILKTSIVFTLLSSLASISLGLFISSKAIVFDGFYEIIDAGMTGVALLAARLIARGDDSRFQYGYWHLEPMLAGLNGLILTFACLYAFVDALNGLIVGGRQVQFQAGAIYSAASGVLSLGLFVYIRRKGRSLGSQLLDLDARAWFMGAVLSLGLCVSFMIGGALSGTEARVYAPYVDSIILLVVALGLLPFPLLTVWRCGKEILQIAPPELDRHVRAVAEAVAQRHGFSDFSSHVMRSGRQQFIEIGLVAPSGDVRRSFEELDAIRAEIADAMGGLSPGYWLTVDFTADKRWV
ncbi:cation diffusion facilitator family transporter [Microvirga pudoricolor]|uniref:cation diffusion facilitator family transporter n=1 Tax=Microvirga pudoricolor TaxID=2778729 RepID=UPI00194DC0E7|nr:cation transporter [Microvirga pudoricolor]MBM6593382.1 cation transporter [Microvirga pudoricolor]